eukprot:gene16524-16083_t
MPAASFGGLVGVLVPILVIFQCKCPVVAVGTVECIEGNRHSWGDCVDAVGALNADPSTQFNFVCEIGEKGNVRYLGGSSETDCKTNAQAMNTLAADASVTCDSYFDNTHYERVHCTRNCGAMEEKCNTHAKALNQILTPTTTTATIATTAATAALTTTAVASTTTITTATTVPSATCTCQDEWGFNGATYNGCAIEPLDPESWCYTTAECSTSNSSETKIAASTPPTLLATAIIDATNETTRILGTLNVTAATTATTAIAAGTLSFGEGNATNDAITDAASRVSNGMVALIVIAVLLCIVGVFLGRRYLHQGKTAGTGTDNNNGLQSPPNQQPGAAGFRGPSDVHHNSAFNVKRPARRSSVIPSTLELAAAAAANAAAHAAAAVAPSSTKIGVELTPNVMYAPAGKKEVVLTPNMMYASADKQVHVGLHPNILYASADGGAAAAAAAAAASASLYDFASTTNSSNIVYAIPIEDPAALNPGPTTSWAGYEMTSTGYQQVEVGGGSGGGEYNAGGGGGGSTGASATTNNTYDMQAPRRRQPATSTERSSSGGGGGSTGASATTNNTYDMQAPRRRQPATSTERSSNGGGGGSTGASATTSNTYDMQAPRRRQPASNVATAGSDTAALNPGPTTSWAGYEMTSTGYQQVEVGGGSGGGEYDAGGGGGAINGGGGGVVGTGGPPPLISRKEINEQKEMGRRKTKRRQEEQEQEHQVKLPRERRRYVNLSDVSSV